MYQKVEYRSTSITCTRRKQKRNRTGGQSENGTALAVHHANEVGAHASVEPSPTLQFYRKEISENVFPWLITSKYRVRG